MSQPELKQIPINQIFASSNYRKTFKDKSLAELDLPPLRFIDL